MKKAFIAAGFIMAMIACKEQSLTPTEDINNHSNAKAGAQTGQGIMVDFQVDANYVITEEVTYHFDKDAAEAYFTNGTVTGPVITTGTGATQPTPAQPAPDPIKNSEIQQQKCTFFNGGQLAGYTYKKTVNGTRGWKWEWTYTVNGALVEPKTAWTSTVTQPGVDPTVPINAYIAGLSMLNSTQHPSKASFSLLSDDGLTNRVQDLKIFVDGVEIAAPANTITNGENFYYATNAGSNGVTSLLTPYEGQWAFTILTTDSFSGNNDPSNAIRAKMDEVVTTLGVGTHSITLTGIVKGNAASAAVPVSVTKTVTINGGCNP